MYKLKAKRLHKDAVPLRYASKGDSGLDLYSVEDVTFEADETKVVPTGWAIALPAATEMQIRPRSGISLKGCHCITPTYKLNADMSDELILEEINAYERVILGTVDNPYRGELGIIVHNEEFRKVTIPKGTKLAQGVIVPVITVDVKEVDELDETERGAGGFGSTGQ